MDYIISVFKIKHLSSADKRFPLSSLPHSWILWGKRPKNQLLFQRSLFPLHRLALIKPGYADKMPIRAEWSSLRHRYSPSLSIINRIKSRCKIDKASDSGLLASDSYTYCMYGVRRSMRVRWGQRRIEKIWPFTIESLGDRDTGGAYALMIHYT